MLESAGRTVAGRLDLELLIGFVAIVDAGSFKQAAAQLNLTQPAISMQIKRLEDRVGCRLLCRSSRASTLTPDGQRLYGYARRIVSLEREARLELSQSRFAGPVRIGVPEWFTGDKLQTALAQFKQGHPDVHFWMEVDTSAALRDAVAAGRLDLALAINESQRENPVHSEPLQWVVGTEQALDVSSDMPLALFDPPCPYRELAIDGLERCGWRGREVFTSASVASVRTAVKSGLGISIFPESAVRGNLRVLTRDEGFPELPATSLTIYNAPHIASTAADQLSQYLNEALQR